MIKMPDNFSAQSGKIFNSVGEVVNLIDILTETGIKLKEVGLDVETLNIELENVENKLDTLIEAIVEESE